MGQKNRSNKMAKINKVKIYTAPGCVYCLMAKNFFKANSIQFEECDVSKDENARDEVIKKTNQVGVPVIEVGDEVIIGFDKDVLDKALGIQ